MSKKADVISSIKKVVAIALKFIKEHKKLTITVLVFIFLYWLVFIPHGGSAVPNVEPKYIYDKVDVNGLTIEKACEKLREKGWKISSVDGVNSYETVEKSDCSDKTHSATTVDYYASDLNSNIYDTASINFNSDKKPASSETKNDAAATKTNTQQQTPKYEIINTKQNVGITNLDEYYVKINPVNLNNDEFKSNVKLIVSAISKEKNTADFMAKIFTDSDVLAYKNNATGYYKDLSETGVTTADLATWTKEMEEKSATTFVAAYTGGFDYNTGKISKQDAAYSISWFSSTFTDNITVGKYVGSEKWKP
ncbi:hypothetical protein CVV43_03700 [Candidatus Saccharibacteria bacterium HGW-Saccharibacteria-1]|nr:MAG: hypothetical protein CVV43_03700 [Candidatus Saccharibacteria bacterium HGW-Saccharibacteria-1]